MNTSEEARMANSADAVLCKTGYVPELRIRVFGSFDATLDGVPISASYSRQRRLQVLIAILALHHGKELYTDYLADSIWPRSTVEKKRHCFDNLWYLATRAVYTGKREDNPYFQRRHHTCRMLDGHVATDAEQVARACDDLMGYSLDPANAIDAYRRLQESYRGDLLPGEAENAIILRARRDWRERVAGALSTAAQNMMDGGEERTALWMATAACRLSGLREDMVRLRMELLGKMGMQAYAVRAYRELEDYLDYETGMPPSPQSVGLMKQMMDASELEFALVSRPSRRRGVNRRRDSETRRKAEFVVHEALPPQGGII